jgi:intracellular septation protein
MKFLYDFLPVLLFFVSYYMYDIFVATFVAIVSSALLVIFFWLRYHRFEKMQLVVLALIVVLGGATLIFQNEAFIMWKPTVVNWLFAMAFLGSQWFAPKPITQMIMEEHVRVDDDRVWTTLNYSWVGFFIFAGTVNLYVAHNFSLDFWVNFRLFGLLSLTFIFVILQGIYLSKHVIEDETEKT